MDKLLVIEDNPAVRENLAELLELSGYEVHTAENGKEGVRQALEVLPDLIICDIMMPELDGFGVLRILSSKPQVSDVPFLFLTAKSEKEDFRRGMGLGADDYITKPFDDVQLLDTIEMRLKKSKKLRASFDGSESGLRHFLHEAAAQAQMLDLTTDRETRTYRQRDELYRIGTSCRWLFFISSGSVKTFKGNEYGKELITHIYRAGEFVGVLPLLRKENYYDSAVALEETECLMIPVEDFEKLLTSSRDISGGLIKILASQIAETEEKLLHIAYGSVREKVAEMLVELHEKYQVDGVARISMLREDLASMAGVAKETAIRTLSDFKDEKVIEIQNHEIVIKDVDKVNNLPY